MHTHGSISCACCWEAAKHGSQKGAKPNSIFNIAAFENTTPLPALLLCPNFRRSQAQTHCSAAGHPWSAPRPALDKNSSRPPSPRRLTSKSSGVSVSKHIRHTFSCCLLPSRPSLGLPGLDSPISPLPARLVAAAAAPAAELPSAAGCSTSTSPACANGVAEADEPRTFASQTKTGTQVGSSPYTCPCAKQNSYTSPHRSATRTICWVLWGRPAAQLEPILHHGRRRQPHQPQTASPAAPDWGGEAALPAPLLSESGSPLATGCESEPREKARLRAASDDVSEVRHEVVASWDASGSCELLPCSLGSVVTAAA